jgi:deoxyribodipyrimidine photolyase-related protein
MLEELPHEGWLTSQIDFEMSKVKGGVQRWRMDAFYRQVRRRTGILMDDDEPMGGKFSFDAENRKPWKGSPPVPIAPRFDPDEVTREVAARVGEDYADHPGTLEPGALPARRQDAETMWQWALAECLPHFGPYEDAMSSSCSGLFHTRVSSLLNLHRILPRRVVEDVAASPVPLASKEGFVRQVLGWREFVHHVHETTDGLRNITSAAPENLEQAGDGGWSRAYGRRWNAIETPEDPDGGAAPNHLGAQRELPPAFWGQPSGLACLDRVIGDVWRDGWSHHITRLMVLSNIATLLDVSPRELCDWFWAAYVDAFDWVVEPNVLAMGTFATGELMTTKPYVSGSAYIHRMSDYCVGCAFDPKNDCPITSLYWAFLDRHHERLASNPRMRIVMSAVRKRSDERLTRDREVFRHVVDRLKQGGELRPGAWSRG